MVQCHILLYGHTIIDLSNPPLMAIKVDPTVLCVTSLQTLMGVTKEILFLPKVYIFLETLIERIFFFKGVSCLGWLLAIRNLDLITIEKIASIIWNSKAHFYDKLIINANDFKWQGKVFIKFVAVSSCRGNTKNISAGSKITGK